MAWTDIPAFTGGQVLTSAVMNQMRANERIGHIVCTSGTRPSAPDEGTMVYETDTSKILVWSGTAWNDVYPLPPTMFSAYGLASYTIGSNVEFRFNNVVANVGSGYSSTTGRFTAPVSGYYMFHYSFLSQASAATVDTRLRVNQSTIIAAAYSGDGVSSYKSGGASAGTFLTAGQYVSVVSFGTSTVHADPVHAVFCGNLVR
jgi:hypothetical protein